MRGQDNAVYPAPFWDFLTQPEIVRENPVIVYCEKIIDNKKEEYKYETTDYRRRKKAGVQQSFL